MIDIVHEIEAVQREIGKGRIAAGEGRAIRLQRDYDAPDRRRLGCADQPGADRPLVPADQRRLPPRRPLPVRGQRRGRDRRLRASEPAQGDLGLRRDGDRRRRLRGRGPAGDRRRRGDPLRAGARAVVPEDCWDEYGPGAVGVGWDRGLLGLTLHLRGESVGDPDRLAAVGRGPRFSTRSSEAWGEANGAAGADPDVASRAGREHDRRSTPRTPTQRRIRRRQPETERSGTVGTSGGGREDLAQRGRERVGLARLAVLAAEEAAVAAGERHRRRAEPLGHGERRRGGPSRPRTPRRRRRRCGSTRRGGRRSRAGSGCTR